jgi:hypothetical protein
MSRGASFDWVGTDPFASEYDPRIRNEFQRKTDTIDAIRTVQLTGVEEPAADADRGRLPE